MTMRNQVVADPAPTENDAAADPAATDQRLAVIEPHSGWRGLDLRELREYGDLALFMTLRTIKVRYAQSALGVGWAIIQPLATMLVFTVVFGRMIGVDTGDTPYAVFSFAALVPWTYFSNCLSDCSGSMVANAQMVSKIYFPRLILPMSVIGARFVDFLIAIVMLVLLMAGFGVAPSLSALAVPLLVLIMTLTAAGLGLFLTALAIQYRDVNYALPFAVQLFMYATPVVYPAELVPEQFRAAYALNPMVGVIGGFRSGLAGTGPLPWQDIAIGGATSVVLFVVGIYYFRRKEHVFADVA